MSTDYNPVIAEVDYLNIEQGLALLGQDHRLYAHLLEHFDEQLNETFIPLVHLLHDLSQGDDDSWVLAQQTAHSLKGVAGNLAANTLAKYATELDTLLKKKIAPPAHLIDLFHEAIISTQTQIRQWISEQTPISTHAPEVRWDRAEMQQRLTQLYAQVMNNEFIDERTLSQLNEQFLATEQAQIWHKIQHALDAFDFDQAQEGLTELMAHYS
jgi:HPt (histidine-containing phosphotransfer) domain-containing protein